MTVQEYCKDNQLLKYVSQSGVYYDKDTDKHFDVCSIKLNWKNQPVKVRYTYRELIHIASNFNFNPEQIDDFLTLVPYRKETT